jgi:hypothetical protein
VIETMTTTSGTATGTFTIKAWDEQPWAELDEAPKLTHARVTTTYTGDLEGEGTSGLLMAYDQADASYTGYERFVGSLDGRPGSFVLRLGGGFTDGAATTTWTVVEGSGTGDLAASGARAATWPGRASPKSPGSCAGRWPDASGVRT